MVFRSTKEVCLVSESQRSENGSSDEDLGRESQVPGKLDKGIVQRLVIILLYIFAAIGLLIWATKSPW